MKKLAKALEVIGWLSLALGVIVGVWLASGFRHINDILLYFSIGALPGALLLLVCLAHKHYLNVAAKVDDYLNNQMSRPMSWQVQPPTFASMQPAPPPASRQQPIQQSQQPAQK